SDVLALANTLPGPINTKLAGYIGWRVGGWRGMLNGLFAAVVPTLILMILLLTVLNAYKDRPWVQGMAKGLIHVVGVMIVVLACDFIILSKKLIVWYPTTILTFISIIILQLFHIHPAFVILALLVAALLSKEKKQEVNQ